MDPTQCTTNELGCRLREIRDEYEERHGGISLPESLGLMPRTWKNYESGVTIPGLQLLQFVERTGVHPLWLLTGRGDRYLAATTSGLFRKASSSLVP